MAEGEGEALRVEVALGLAGAESVASREYVPPREYRVEALMVTDSVGGVACEVAERDTVPEGVFDLVLVSVGSFAWLPACNISCNSSRSTKATC